MNVEQLENGLRYFMDPISLEYSPDMVIITYLVNRVGCEDLENLNNKDIPLIYSENNLRSINPDEQFIDDQLMRLGHQKTRNQNLLDCPYRRGIIDLNQNVDAYEAFKIFMYAASLHPEVIAKVKDKDVEGDFEKILKDFSNKRKLLEYKAIAELFTQKLIDIDLRLVSKLSQFGVNFYLEAPVSKKRPFEPEEYMPSKKSKGLNTPDNNPFDRNNWARDLEDRKLAEMLHYSLNAEVKREQTQIEMDKKLAQDLQDAADHEIKIYNEMIKNDELYAQSLIKEFSNQNEDNSDNKDKGQLKFKH